MGLLEMSQIKSRITDEYEGLLDLSDAIVRGEPTESNEFLSRALAAYSINVMYTEIDNSIVANSITDGSKDNGIDLIYYNKEKNELCLVQSKYNHKGNSEPKIGEIQSFICGVKDLINTKFDKFNQKVNDRRDEIVSILEKSKLKFKIILVYTATNLSQDARREFNDLLEELNDFRDVAELEIINQKRLYASLHNKKNSRNIDIDIDLKDWGRYEGEMEAVYGQVSALQIADWWENYGNSLYDYNLRKVLGNTQINDEIRSTIETEPELFWYYNNGITIVCEELDKKRKGNTKELGTFECKGISVVNGAQTVGVIGKYAQTTPTSVREDGKGNLDNVYVPLRIISITSVDDEEQEYLNEAFASAVTTKNNRQNEIKERDFISLDGYQKKIERDLALIGIKYHLMRSEEEETTETSFGVREATRAVSFAKDIEATILVKRELGSIFADIDSPAYKKLFNDSVTSYYIWNCVKIERIIADKLELKKAESPVGERLAILLYGKEIVSKLVFDSLGKELIPKDSTDLSRLSQSVNFEEIIEQILSRMVLKVRNVDKTPSNIFKNKRLMRDIYEDVKIHILKQEVKEDSTSPELEQFQVENVEGLSRVERLQLSSFMDKIKDDDQAVELFRRWLEEIYDSEQHYIGYKTNIHFYRKDESSFATEKFIFRLAYYTKLIISLEFNVYGSKYRSTLMDNENFVKWAQNMVDDKQRIIIDSMEKVEQFMKIKDFI
ncbi:MULTISPECIES: AIPR family protein [Bacillus amyloliquefaciens group]|uniref:AIPR family protein n=1 Tax=Bacillus amyloliquefaciens group TaxID=1938374 RepID=UPI00226E6E3B|nr:AIPR family protein [Bacillus velezensis]MCY0090507.1 AIPR family protein [Bacillus velezensis]